jgi:Ca-activated chloride channel family protein
MQGDSIEQARRALELCLRALAEGDRFNICRFGSTFELLSPQPLVYSGETLRQALGYVQAVDANLGGTELLPPLQAILKQPPAGGGVRQIVLLTDGQLGNEEAVIDLARRHRQSNRIFTFGIGWASSAFLVRGLARATGGAAEFVTAGERIEDKVLRTFGRMASPLIGDIELDGAGAELTLADPDTPAVFEGDALALFARAAGPLPEQVILRMSTPDGPVSWTVPVPPPQDDGGLIATLWARRRIQHLEQDRPREGRFAPRERRHAKQLIQVSRDFGLLCSLTRFLAVEHRTPEERDDGQPELRRVPVQLARGWGGVDFDGLRQMMPRARSPHSHFIAGFAARGTARRARSASDDSNLLARFALVAPATSDALLELLASQQADGHFHWGPDRAEQRLRLNMESRRRALRSRLEQLLGKLPPDADRIVDTLVTLMVFEALFAERRRQWKRAAKKARRFLEAASPAVDLSQLLKPGSLLPK